MQRELRKHLYDIAQACDLIAQFTAGRTFEDYAGDALLRSAVERQFEMVGEALSRLVQTDPAVAQLITDARQIIAFRNRLAHGYDSVSHELVWSIMQTDLPVLRREVRALLDAPDAAI